MAVSRGKHSVTDNALRFSYGLRTNLNDFNRNTIYWMAQAFWNPPRNKLRPCPKREGKEVVGIWLTALILG